MGSPRFAAASEDEIDVPRLALTKTEAARTLGVSVDFFDLYVLPEIRIVRRGRRRLIPLDELRRWLDDSAARTPES